MAQPVNDCNHIREQVRPLSQRERVAICHGTGCCADRVPATQCYLNPRIGWLSYCDQCQPEAEEVQARAKAEADARRSRLPHLAHIRSEPTRWLPIAQHPDIVREPSAVPAKGAAGPSLADWAAFLDSAKAITITH